MKRLLVLVVLFFSISLFFLQSSSYTVADLETDAAVSIVSEENALIAVRYDVVPRFWITNNTDKTVYIERVEIFGAFDYGFGNFQSVIPPGGIGEFTITGNTASVNGNGNTLQISARWDTGKAEISSVLPSFIIEEEPSTVPDIPAVPIEKNEEKEGKEEQENQADEEEAIPETEDKSAEVKEQQPDTQAESNSSESTTDTAITSPVEATSTNTSEED